ncbi:hypothetical protein Ga0061079_101187 [Apibacter mensalis]|uniref:Uncharacterized protein n=1 Tax=Apibacter mensalis TaxID=1586267 RepID=A0A0X3AMB3_9FLAO|nr:hypothetical protein Ga0061079_101187 [Apibacter mensalis]
MNIKAAFFGALKYLIVWLLNSKSSVGNNIISEITFLITGKGENRIQLFHW